MYRGIYQRVPHSQYRMPPQHQLPQHQHPLYPQYYGKFVDLVVLTSVIISLCYQLFWSLEYYNTVPSDASKCRVPETMRKSHLCIARLTLLSYSMRKNPRICRAHACILIKWWKISAISQILSVCRDYLEIISQIEIR